MSGLAGLMLTRLMLPIAGEGLENITRVDFLKIRMLGYSRPSSVTILRSALLLSTKLSFTT